MQSNFFAVILNPSTQAESTGFENSEFQVPMARKPAGNRSKPHITGGADPHTAGNEDGRSKIQSKTEKPGTETWLQRKCSRVGNRKHQKSGPKNAPEWHIKSARRPNSQVSQTVQMVPNYYELAGCIYCRADCGAAPPECSFFFLRCSVLKRAIEGRKTDFMKPADSACDFGCKMTAKKLDCTGSLCLGVGQLFNTRYGRLSG